jgi:hypothetical protein
MQCRRTIWIALLAAATCLAQQILNNDSIIRMAKAGLSDSLIVTAIDAQPGQYDTSANGIIALKAAGVSDTVIAALLTRSAAPAMPALAPSMPAAAPASAPANPDDPNSAHEPGMYLFSSGKMSAVQPSPFKRSLFGVERAHIAGGHSAARAKAAGFTIYFFFADSAADRAGSVFGDAVSPDEFVLLPVKVKGSERELAIARIPGMHWEADLHDKIAADVVRLRAGVYKLTPRVPLPPGEYGVFALRAMAQPPSTPATIKVDNQVFDFGID